MYIGSDSNVPTVEVTAVPRFQTGPPKALFPWPGEFSDGKFEMADCFKEFGVGAPAGDFATDGRALVALPIAPTRSAPFTVVLNWQAALKKPRE